MPPRYRPFAPPPFARTPQQRVRSFAQRRRLPQPGQAYGASARPYGATARPNLGPSAGMVGAAQTSNPGAPPYQPPPGWVPQPGTMPVNSPPPAPAAAAPAPAAPAGPALPAAITANPGYVAGLAALEDALAAALQGVGSGKEMAGAQLKLLLERLGITQTESERQSREGANARGIFGSGIMSQDLGQLGQGFGQQREDAGFGYAQTLSGLAQQEAEAKASYGTSLSELLMQAAQSAAQDTSLAYGPQEAPQQPQGPGEPKPGPADRRHTHQHGGGGVTHHGQKHNGQGHPKGPHTHEHAK